MAHTITCSIYAFFLILTKLMSPYGGMHFGVYIKCWKRALKVRCEEYLGVYMLIVGAVLFWVHSDVRLRNA